MKNQTKLKNSGFPAFSPGSVFWPKGLTPFPFQLDSVRFAVSRLSSHRAVYLALDPGLGKTVVAAILSNLSAEVSPCKILYVCPPSLTANVEAEFEKWGFWLDVTIVGDSDLGAHQGGGYTLAFIDEAHRFKNEKAQRSAALFEKLARVKKIVFLSGTPMPNMRPVELWTLLSRYAVDVFGPQFFSFGRKYCGGRKDAFGWKFDKFTNKTEFKARLFKSFMLRMKKEVLDLPPLREGILTVGTDFPPVIGNLEREVLRRYTKSDLLEGRLTRENDGEGLHLAKYLRLLGDEKVKHLYPFIDHLLTDTEENFLFFAHHKSVIDALANFLAKYKPIVITGATPKAARVKAVADFQAGKTRVGVLNIAAAGIGWNIQRADRIIMVEQSWRDGDNVQCGHRAHRIGRDRPVLMQYVVLKDSFDAQRMQVILSKRNKEL